MKRRQYYYVVVFYKVEKDGTALEWNASTYLCKTDETNPAGIPTMGYLISQARKAAKKEGAKYVEDTLYISNMMKLTKAQYDNLMNKDEPC